LGINDTLKLATNPHGDITSWDFFINNLGLLLTTPDVVDHGINYAVISSNHDANGTFDEGMLDFGFALNQNAPESWAPSSPLFVDPLPVPTPILSWAQEFRDSSRSSLAGA
jgi:hypothetical protein